MFRPYRIRKVLFRFLSSIPGPDPTETTGSVTLLCRQSCWSGSQFYFAKIIRFYIIVWIRNKWIRTLDSFNTKKYFWNLRIKVFFHINGHLYLNNSLRRIRIYYNYYLELIQWTDSIDNKCLKGLMYAYAFLIYFIQNQGFEHYTCLPSMFENNLLPKEINDSFW